MNGKIIINCKTRVRTWLNKFGFDIIPYHSRKNSQPEYNWCNPYNYNTYSPWFSRNFQEIYSKVSAKTVVKEDRCYIIHQLAKQCINLPGNFAECGVYMGGTAFLTASAMQEAIPEKEYHLFDTFAGMGEWSETDASGHKAGDFANTSLNDVKDFLSTFKFIQYFPGHIPHSFASVPQGIYSFVHI